MRRFLAGLMTGLLVLVLGASGALGGVSQARLTRSSQIYGPLADFDGDGLFDSSFQTKPGSNGLIQVSLYSFGGARRWSFSIQHQATGMPGENPFPDPLAAGDFTGDSIDDYVFAARGPLQPESRCGPYLETWSQLAFVDGRTGSLSWPLPPIPNKCWSFPAAGVTYPTHRWPGSVLIGELTTALNGLEVMAIPTYPPEERGWVVNLQHNGQWTKVVSRAGTDSLVFPSHPDFANHYNSFNTTPCSVPKYYTDCHIPNSHVPTGLMIGPPGGRGALLLTTFRALVYQPDLIPTSDTTWTSGTTANSGRNYGYAFTFASGGQQHAALIGGCSVEIARKAMKSGELPGGPQNTSLGSVDAHCGIHHHYESFRLPGATIAGHVNHYYSYSVDDGFFHDRPEFPGTAVGPVGGPGTSWTVYNLFDAPRGSQGAGSWRIEMRPDAADPTRIITKPGWFVWDVADLNGDGMAELLATRERLGSTTPYIPQWEFDVLKWNGSDLQSVFHVDGVAPALFKYPNRAEQYYSGGPRSGILSTKPDRGGASLFVENQVGTRSLVHVPGERLR